jgi:hypothetical protein
MENDDLSSSTSYIGSNLLLNPLKQQYGLKIFFSTEKNNSISFNIIFGIQKDNEAMRQLVLPSFEGLKMITRHEFCI